MNNSDKTKQTVYIIFDSNDSSVSSFSSYLVAALNCEGIDVIFDKTGTKLEKGRLLGIKLVLVVLSNPFMFSVACLENLVKLHEFLQEKGHVGIPVFYDEGVSVLKEQMGMCEALAVLEKSYSVDQVTKWRRALVKTMDLQGHEYNDELREESEFIEMIAQDVFEKLYPTEHIGIHKVLLELENLLCKQPWGLRTLAILGKSGIGKTTLVKAAFHKMSSGYDASRFIRVSDENITELLSDEDFKEIPMEKFDLNNQDAEPCHRSKRVLIVLDDVRNALDVKAFLSGFARFGPGSLLIITSRDRPVLEECNVNEIYDLKGLNNEDSLKLFTRCFFGEDVIDEKLLKLAVGEIQRCDGNPSTIRSYAEEKKGKKTVNMEPALGNICHDSFKLNSFKLFAIPLKQPFLLTFAHNYHQSDLEKFPGHDIASHIFEYRLHNLGFPYLDLNSLQQSFFCATSHSYLSDRKDLPRLHLPSHVLESLPSDLKIPHFGQESVLACQLNKPWKGYKAVQEPSVPCHQVFINFRGAELRQNFISFLEPALKTAVINVQEPSIPCHYRFHIPWKRDKSFLIGHFEKQLFWRARKIEQIDFPDCTRILVTDKLEPSQVLNLRGCIEIKRFQEFVRAIREFNINDKILEWRLQAHLCPLSNSANETGSHLHFDFTFIWSVPTTICNRIHVSLLQSWEDVLFALLNITRSKAKKILRGIEWQLTIYNLWIERNHRLYNYKQSYRSAQVDRFIRNITSVVRKSRRKIASEIP